MEKFPNLANKQENPNKLVEALRKKINIAILYGSISLTALVAVGCGSKKAQQAGANEGTSRFPKAEEVVKVEKGRDAVFNRVLDDISFHRFNFEEDGSLIIELHGVKWQLSKTSIDSLKSQTADKLDTISSPNTSRMIKDMSYKSLRQRFDLIISANGKLLNTNEVKMTETRSEKTENGQKIQTKTRTIERNNTPKKDSIRTSPNFDKQDDF